MAKAPPLIITVRVLPDGAPFSVKGRPAWALQALHFAGSTGCTPLDTPGPRWSGYVHRLRGMGINVQTVTEGHGGQFAGHHARYVLRSTISLTVVSDTELEAA